MTVLLLTLKFKNRTIKMQIHPSEIEKNIKRKKSKLENKKKLAFLIFSLIFLLCLITIAIFWHEILNGGNNTQATETTPRMTHATQISVSEGTAPEMFTITTQAATASIETDKPTLLIPNETVHLELAECPYIVEFESSDLFCVPEDSRFVDICLIIDEGKKCLFNKTRHVSLEINYRNKDTATDGIDFNSYYS